MSTSVRSLPEWQQHWQAVESAKQAKPHAALYALIDVGQHPSLLEQLSQWDIEKASLFVGTAEAVYDQDSPRLLNVNSESLGSTLCRWAEDLPCLSWIYASVSLGPLAAHLRTWLAGLLLDEDGSELGEVLVRHYDPRVLPAFMAALTHTQQAQLMQPIQSWGVWSRLGVWQHWEAPPEAGTLQCPPRTQPYTQEQSACMDEHTQVDRLLALLNENYGDKIESDPLAKNLQENLLGLAATSRYRRLHQVVQRGRQQGLIQDEDLMLFAALALGMHPQFDQHPAVKAVIERTAVFQSSFALGVTSLPAATWAEVQAIPADFYELYSLA